MNFKAFPPELRANLSGNHGRNRECSFSQIRNLLKTNTSRISGLPKKWQTGGRDKCLSAAEPSEFLKVWLIRIPSFCVDDSNSVPILPLPIIFFCTIGPGSSIHKLYDLRSPNSQPSELGNLTSEHQYSKLVPCFYWWYCKCTLIPKSKYLDWTTKEDGSSSVVGAQHQSLGAKPMSVYRWILLQRFDQFWIYLIRIPESFGFTWSEFLNPHWSAEENCVTPCLRPNLMSSLFHFSQWWLMMVNVYSTVSFRHLIISQIRHNLIVIILSLSPNGWI